jgi:hypothetical protein
MTTILPEHLDYTDVDQASLERRLMRLIDTSFPEWTERQRANFGNLMVGCLAFIGDTLGFMMDNAAAESRWSTAQLRKSLLAMASLIQYRPATAQPATVDMVLTLEAALAGTLPIPSGSRIRTNEVTQPVEYQTLADVTFAPGELTKTVSAENSETHEEVFTSSSLARQVFVLSQRGVIGGSVRMVAADGTYTEVENLLDSTAVSKHFTVSVDASDRGVVRCGDDRNGSIPRGSVTVTYKTGGGVKGRVEPNRLKRLMGTFHDSLGTQARITCTNPFASSGGTDRQSNASIRKQAPRSVTVQKRAVSRPDYEIVAENVPGVARALHLTGNQTPSIGENAGLLLLVPEGLGTASQALCDLVAAQFDPDTGEFPKTNTYQLLVIPAPYLLVNKQVTVFLKSGVSRPVARAQIMSKLSTFFALTTTDATGQEVDNERINFGFYMERPVFDWSDILSVITSAAGVDSVDPGPFGLLLNGARDDVTIEPQQFPKLGDVVLIDGRTGESF